MRGGITFPLLCKEGEEAESTMVGFLQFLKRKRLGSPKHADSLKSRSESTCMDDSTEHEEAPWRASKFMLTDFFCSFVCLFLQCLRHFVGRCAMTDPLRSVLKSVHITHSNHVVLSLPTSQLRLSKMFPSKRRIGG